MTNDMGWKSIEFQIEALLPGLLLVAALALILPTEPLHEWLALLPAGEFSRAALFVAAAYSIGLVSAFIARAVVDVVSEHGPRAMVLSRFSHVPRAHLVAKCRQLDGRRFEDDLKKNQGRRKKPNPIDEWNAAYRSVIRTTGNHGEVDRRRSQGRYVRNLLLVGAVGPIAVLGWSPTSAVLGVVGICLVVLLYAYAEYAIFAEAYDIAPDPPSEP